MVKIKKEWNEFKVLLRNVPATVMSLFIVSVVIMNLLANKELSFGWAVTDCGIIASWMAFLTSDMLTKRFGPKAAIEMSLFAEVVNLGVCAIFFIVSKIPNNWALAYDMGEAANEALNATIGGTWYVLMGSTVAFIASSIINAYLNAGIGKLCKKDNFISYALRSYVSTAIGQFSDNFIFALIVSYVFFGWSIGQCVIAACITGVIELICEVIFGGFGYKTLRKWEARNVGAEYLALVNKG